MYVFGASFNEESVVCEVGYLSFQSMKSMTTFAIRPIL